MRLTKCMRATVTGLERPRCGGSFGVSVWYKPVAGRTQSGAQARFNANEKRNLARLQAARDADASDDTGDVGDSGYQSGIKSWPDAEKDDYLAGERYPQTRQEYLDDDFLDNATAATIRYAINEMYARHGYEFPQSSAIRGQFTQFDWYAPIRGRTQAQAQKRFNTFERANLQKLIGVRDMAR